MNGAPAGTADVLCEIHNQVAAVTLNRPAALNALSLGMIRKLRSVLGRCATDPGVRAVLLRGAGEKAFCAGGDIRALYESVRTGGSVHREFCIAEYPLDFLLYSFPKPFVALLDGIVMGGGMGIAQGSTLRVVGERTRMAMPEVGIGLFPDVGASWFLSRLPGSLGPYVALSGVQLRGADAVYAGLADVFLPAEAIAELPAQLAALDWGADDAAQVRRVVHAGAARGLAAPSLSILRTAIDEHFSKASVHAIVASLETETRAEFRDWARQTVQTLRTRSPIMLCVALRQLELGRTLALSDCFRMELGMMQHSFHHGDFLEGVRAVIIDKDNSPHWNPARLEDVDDAAVEAFFRPYWPAQQHPLADLAGNGWHA